MSNLKPEALRYEEVQIGQSYSFETSLSAEDLAAFAKLTGDFNPIHLDSAYAKRTSFKKPVVYGMLAGSLFSRLIGMYCPGERSLYLSQTLQFRKPIFPGQIISVKGTVTQKTDASKMVTLQTEIFTDGVLAILGEARAQFITEEAA